MRPDDPKMQHPSLFVPQRPQAPQLDGARATQSRHQKAAAEIARQQIDSIYDNDPNSKMDIGQKETAAAKDSFKSTSIVASESPQQSTQPIEDLHVLQPPNAALEPFIQPSSSPKHQVIIDRKQQYAQPEPLKFEEQQKPHERNHDETRLQVDSEDWNKYHSAWQQYYKEYFHRYYSGHILQTRAAYESQASRIKELESRSQELTPEQAMDDIRSQLRAKIAEKSKKVRKSRHFMPIMAAVAVMTVFLFLQYNRVVFAYANAYVSPGTIDPANIIVDPNTAIQVSREPRLIIPKINVDVPVIYKDTMGRSQAETYEKQMDAMAKGVAWFGIDGADSYPGQNGNTVLSGHSSNDWFDLGDLKFVFANLEKLKKDDTIYINYEGTRYTYSVTNTKVVLPTELSALKIGDDKPMLTLLTCTPLGTSQKRLLVFAEQISPDPNTAKSAPSSAPGSSPTEIPGVKSKFLGGLFG